MRESFLAILLMMFLPMLSAQELQTKKTATAASAGNPRSPSNVVLQDLALEGSAFETFATVIRVAGKSGGIVNVTEDCAEESKKTLSVRAGTTLSQALEAIAANVNSEWRMQDNVPNMFPRGSVPPLLLIHIRHFEWDKTAPLDDVFRQLSGLPELSQGARDLGLKPQPFQSATGTMCIRNCPTNETRPAPMLIEEKDISLLTLLNHIVGVHKGSVWAYWEYHCNSETTFAFSTAAWVE